MTSQDNGVKGSKVLDQVTDMVSNMDFVSGGDAHVAAINAERTALGLSSLPKNEQHLNDVPDVPACDYCSKPESGNFHCSKCKF